MENPIRPRLFAATPDGTRLPVIDLTDPAFATATSDPDVAKLRAAALAEEARLGPVTRLLFRLILRRLARQSPLVAALQAANDGFLGGIPTYVMKLGPTNLVPPYASDIDKRIAASPTVTSMRVRLVQVASLLADSLAPELEGDTSPLVILDIAGGPSADALNALVLLEQRGLLAGRTALIEIYDPDTSGPAFAANMLEALQAGPLAGRDVSVRHTPGDWRDTASLSRLLESAAPEAVIAATSEGGLFEYGSDDEIAGVLQTLRDRVEIITGSVTRDDDLIRLMRRHSKPRTRPRGLERFGALIAPTGYRIATSRPSPLSDQVLLTRS